MTTDRPWEKGTHAERWDGYLIESGSSVLRNLVGATSEAHLRDAENDFVEYRLVELRERPQLIVRTFDLPHILSIHRQLFQDVYAWAGQLRTVGLAKGGGESFMPPAEITRPILHVAARIRETDRLGLVSDDDLPTEIAYLYDYLNFAHPFREGNGRTQREFFSHLVEAAGYSIDWNGVDRDALHHACHVARNDSDDGPLRQIFTRIVSHDLGATPLGSMDEERETR
ncbi:cell filamentation protein [Labedella gwakjiensis]|uniref:protein adenylyltransferase n=1 Tax=Labedella gwakjiensis TaxID=390269 RepID=A0A2P8GWQ4_9MICO|nr:Fic family protein [Labedella gwakjiensis]PSL38401.1 cell filamentation protein [Labedella gwakjiensis]RUQ87072.1 cell filamentation protein Fic [Labedella gwakjiensis]